jgi:hypothetical protein
VGNYTGFCGARVAAAVLCVAVLFATTANAKTQARIALVIGNSAYASNPLPNPVNDARLISSTLRELGFEVIEHLDVTRKKMRRAIVKFEGKSRAGRPTAVGLFYYAGHGLQVKGKISWFLLVLKFNEITKSMMKPWMQIIFSKRWNLQGTN